MTVLIPELPQDDRGQNRERKLDDARKDYQFNYTHIPTLSVLDDLPRSENPDLNWLIKVVDVLFKALRNTIEVCRNTDLNIPANELESQLDAIFETVGTKETTEIIADLFGLLHLARPVGRPRDLDDYQLLFQSAEIPDVFDLVLDDDHFAELRLTGSNPLMLKQVNSLEANFPVTDAIFQSLNDFADDSLALAGNEGRLYVADYDVLSTMNPGSLASQPKYVYAPFALFALTRHDKILKPVAIQCNQDPDTNPILTPNDGWSWQIAKTAVQVADGNYHELISHLSLTHLVIEPIAVSLHRQLSYRHPLYLLLESHIEGTFFINASAHKFLLPEGTPVPYLLTGDTDSLHAQVLSAVKRFSFKDSFLPVALAQRGLDDTNQLPFYPYRDDALKIWYATKEWVSEYLHVYYSDDGDVLDDWEVQAWAQEIGNEEGGRIADFVDDNGGISSLDSLIETVTMIIFTASTQHAAVNFPQKDLMSYVPLSPLAGYFPAPTDNKNTEDDFLNMFAPMDNAAVHLDMLTLLGAVYHTTLGQYSITQFSDLRVTTPLFRYKTALEEIEGQIEQRNTQLIRPYNTLRPSLIPQSINI